MSVADVAIGLVAFGLIVSLVLIVRVLRNEAALYEALVVMSRRIGEIEDVLGFGQSNIVPELRDGAGVPGRSDCGERAEPD